MRGVDLLDSHIGRYRISLRSKKWYFRIFCHLIDVATANAWLLFRRARNQHGTPTSMPLWELRVEVAKYLCLIGSFQSRKRVRPSDIENSLEIKHHKGPAASVPPLSIRTDEFSHWPDYINPRQRCKLPECKGFSHIKCIKLLH